jgi:hypothetical protein
MFFALSAPCVMGSGSSSALIHSLMPYSLASSSAGGHVSELFAGQKRIVGLRNVKTYQPQDGS